MANRGWIFPTSYATPFALVLRGGSAEGNRPATRMAFIVEAVAIDGRIDHFRGYLGDAKLSGWTKSVRRIETSEVLKAWRNRPSDADIARHKARLAKKPIPSEP